ncbi:MAG: nucleotidyltransferase family protein [Anaerolineae bacterium]
MSRPTPSLDHARLVKTLTTVLDHAMPTCKKVRYCLVGTGAALLQGVPLPAADIDILVKERDGVDKFSLTLSGFQCLTAPAWLAESQQYFSSYVVHGIQVEFNTVEVTSGLDTIETYGRGPWEHFTLIPCGSYAIPTIRLELRLMTELFRNRPDRYSPLLQFMQVNGCDVNFIQRGIVVMGLSKAMQDDVLEKLKGAPSRILS